MHAAMELQALDTGSAYLAASRSAVALDAQACQSAVEPRSSTERKNHELTLAPANENQLGYLLKLLRDADHKIETPDLLYLFLSYFVSSHTAKDCSDKLLEHFGNLGRVLAASWSRLDAVSERANDVADAIKAMHAIHVGVMQESFHGRPIISGSRDIYDYLKAKMAHLSIETCRILFLDSANGLIKDELHTQGTLDRTPFYPRQVVQRALDLNAKAVILVHNHPSGAVNPSQLDVVQTQQLAKSLKHFDILVHDHIIVGPNDFFSFARLGFLRDIS